MREEIKIKLLQNILKEITIKYDDFIKKQQELYNETFEKAVKDSLTGLYNREYFFDYLKKSLEKLKRNHLKGFVIFLDLDNFKNINDNYGHETGDKVLKNFANILHKNFRDYDVIARYGGDEFIIFMENHEKENIKKRFNILEKKVEEYFKNFDISVSYGMSNYPDDAKNVEELIKIADQRMYEYKKLKKASR